MSLRRWMVGSLILGASACGPMPGYYVRPPSPPPGKDLEPQGPPAPPHDAPVTDEATEDVEDAQPADGDAEAPALPRPRPPRYVAPENWAPDSPPLTDPPKPAPGVKVIELDADTSYLIDEARGLCFFRHRGALAPVDCAKITPPSAPREEKAPPASRDDARSPQRKPTAPAISPEAEPPSGDPSPEELVKFEAAFADIYCDRKAQSEAPPEGRIAARGLSVPRYEAIETWWASDEKAWWTLTQRASANCKR